MESNNYPGSKLLKAIDWTALIAKLKEKHPNVVPTPAVVLQRAADSLVCAEHLMDGRWWSTMLGRHPDYPQSFYGLGRLLGQYPWIAKELLRTEDQGEIKARVALGWYEQEARKAKEATERAADIQGIADSTAKAVVKQLNERLPEQQQAERVGVSLFDVAILLEQDEKMATKMVKQWGGIRPFPLVPLGQCPEDGRRSIYELTGILEFAKKRQQLEEFDIAELRTGLAPKLRAAKRH